MKIAKKTIHIIVKVVTAVVAAIKGTPDADRARTSERRKILFVG